MNENKNVSEETFDSNISDISHSKGGVCFERGCDSYLQLNMKEGRGEYNEK